jgi:hypothetical protein
VFAADAKWFSRALILGRLDHVMVRAPRSRRTGRKGFQVSGRAKVCYGRTVARVVLLLSPGGLNWDQSRPIASYVLAADFVATYDRDRIFSAHSPHLVAGPAQ